MLYSKLTAEQGKEKLISLYMHLLILREVQKDKPRL